MTSEGKFATLLAPGLLIGLFCTAGALADEPVLHARKAAADRNLHLPETPVVTPAVYPIKFCPRDAARRQATTLSTRRSATTDLAITTDIRADGQGDAERLRSMSFSDGLMGRIADTRKVEFVSLLKTTDSDVFLGVTRSGVVGIHVDLRNVLPTRSH